MVAIRREQLEPAEHAAGASRPALLLLSAWHPEPIDNGAKQRVRMMIHALADEYSIVLISLLPANELESGDLPRVPGVRRQYAVPMPAYDGHSVRSALVGLARTPRSLVSTWDQRTSLAIQTIAVRHRAAVALAFDLRLVLYLTSLAPQCRTVLDEPNVSPFAPLPVNLTLAGVRGRLRSWKYKQLMEHISPQIDAILAPSQVELDAYYALGGRSAHYVIENAVPGIPADSWTPPVGRQLLYTGSITYSANSDAVHYFANEIFPVLRASGLPAELTVTGALPDGLEPGPFAAGVRLTGRVADLDAQLRAARLFIAPIREGTGTRIKILEAMGYGMPVISTSKGVEGLPVESGVHLIVADDPDSFAGACCRLLDDTDLSCQLGARARALVQREFTWDIQAQRIRAAIAEVRDATPTPAMAAD